MHRPSQARRNAVLAEVRDLPSGDSINAPEARAPVLVPTGRWRLNYRGQTVD